jgi:hypothetical protein
MVSLKIERDGETISAPRIWSLYGTDAAVQMGESFRIELNVNDLGASADLKMKLYANKTGSLQLVASPRIQAVFSTESAIQVTGQDGSVYRITITPIKAPQPV